MWSECWIHKLWFRNQTKSCGHKTDINVDYETYIFNYIPCLDVLTIIYMRLKY